MQVTALLPSPKGSNSHSHGTVSFAVGSQQQSFVSRYYIRIIGDICHEHIHANPADYRADMATDADAAKIGKLTEIAVRISGSNDRQNHTGLRYGQSSPSEI